MRFDNNTTSPPNLGTSEKKTIHNVIILDRSGSMSSNGKYSIAEGSINEELQLLKKDSSVNYTNTVIEFDSYNQDVVHFYKEPIARFGGFFGKGPRNYTALHDCVGNTLERLIKEIKPELDERVLVKIFTDGGENDSKGKYRHANLLANIIKEAQDIYKFTVTFIGTDRDVSNMVRNIGIHKSNTLSHDNTAESVLRSVKTRTEATLKYAKSVAGGASAETLTQNFFKGLKND